MNRFHVVSGLIAPATAELLGRETFDQALNRTASELMAENFDPRITNLQSAITAEGLLLVAVVEAVEDKADIGAKSFVEDKTYTLDETAALLGFSRSTVSKHARTGELESVRLGNGVRIPGRAIAARLGVPLVPAKEADS